MEKTIELKATGERVTVLRPPNGSNGADVQFMVSLPQNGEGPPLHIHPLQTETFEAVEGTLGLLVESKTMEIKPGGVYKLPPNKVHSFYNPNEGELRFKVSFDPTLNMEWFGREMIAASNRSSGKVRKRLEEAVILWKMRKEYKLYNDSFMSREILRPILYFLSKFTGIKNSVNLEGFEKVP